MSPEERETKRREREAAMKAESRRCVLDAAVQISQEVGLAKMTRTRVSQVAQRSAGTVNYAYGNMDGLREAVVLYAIAHQIAVLVGQGLALGIDAAKNAPPDLKDAALSTLS